MTEKETTCQRRRGWIAGAVVYAAGLLWVSVTPATYMGRLNSTLFPGADKVFHFVAYLFFAIILAKMLGLATNRRIAMAAVAGVCAGAYGFALEGMQGALGWRCFSLWDLGANVAGAAVGSAVVIVAIALRRGRPSHDSASVG